MTEHEFVVWLKGFVEACNDFTATPKQWDRIKEVLEEVSNHKSTAIETDSKLTINRSTGNTYTYSTKIWNDQMGNWHYVNYPEGFGYYEKSDSKKEKQQLND